MRTMIDPKTERNRLQMLLADTVTLLCKSGLHYTRGLQIQGLLGVTVDNDQVFIVHFNESISIEESPVTTLNQSVDCKPSDNNKIKSPVHRAGSLVKSCTQDKHKEAPMMTNLKNKRDGYRIEKSKSNDTSTKENISESKTVLAETTSQQPSNECCENIYSEADTSFLPLVIVTEDNMINNKNYISSNDKQNVSESSNVKPSESKSVLNCSVKFEPTDDRILNGDDTVNSIVDDNEISNANNMMSNLVKNNSTDNDRSTSCQDSSSDVGELSYYTSAYYTSDVAPHGGLLPCESSLNSWSVHGMDGTGIMNVSHYRRSLLDKYDGSVSETLGEGEFHYCCVDGCNKKFLHRRHLLRHQTFKHGRVPTRRKGLTRRARRSVSHTDIVIAPEDFMEGLVNRDGSINMDDCVNNSITLVESSATDLQFDGESMIELNS